MKKYKLVGLLTLAIGASAASCARVPENSARPGTSPAFFTDNQGPSKESGDCGGYAFWLVENNGQYRSGEVAQFEGGCGVYRQAMLEVVHDPKTGTLTFLAPSVDSNQLLRFQGRVHASGLEGTLEQLTKKDRKRLTGLVYKTRTFPRTDWKDFEARLPQNR